MRGAGDETPSPSSRPFFVNGQPFMVPAPKVRSAAAFSGPLVIGSYCSNRSLSIAQHGMCRAEGSRETAQGKAWGRSGVASDALRSSIGFPGWIIFEVEVVHLQPVPTRGIAADLESTCQSDAEDHPHASLDAALQIGDDLRTWRLLVFRV